MQFRLVFPSIRYSTTISCCSIFSKPTIASKKAGSQPKIIGLRESLFARLTNRIAYFPQISQVSLNQVLLNDTYTEGTTLQICQRFIRAMHLQTFNLFQQVHKFSLFLGPCKCLIYPHFDDHFQSILMH